MSGGAGAGWSGSGDPGSADAAEAIRRWVAAHLSLLSAGAAGPAWARAEMLFDAWARFADAFAEAEAARQGGAGARPFDPMGWLRPEGGGGMADMLRWLEGPDFAEDWTGLSAAIRGTREWVAYLAAVEQIKAVAGQAWIAAFRAFLERLSAEASQTLAEEGWQGVLRLWRETSGTALAELYRSPAFLIAMRDLLRAETALRAGMRARVETVAAGLGLPTRAELDDLSATVHALRREIRALRASGGGDGSR